VGYILSILVGLVIGYGFRDVSKTNIDLSHKCEIQIPQCPDVCTVCLKSLSSYEKLITEYNDKLSSLTESYTKCREDLGYYMTKCNYRCD
jgi:hypothetical protein